VREIRDPGRPVHPTGGREIREEPVPLEVDPRVDVVHDFSREAGDTDARIEARRPEPEEPTPRVRTAVPPEPHVVAPPGALPDELLEREVLRPPSRDEVRAHGCRRIRAREEDAAGVADSAHERDAIRREPPRGSHPLQELGAGAGQRHVDGVGRDPLGRVREAGERSRIRREADVAAPDGRQHDVSERRVRRQQKRDEQQTAQDGDPGSHETVTILRSGT
jgi:hypothetical protein